MRIDWWTLALQTVNALVLIWILARFFFRPVANIIAKRQEEANKLLADAAATRQQAADTRAAADQVRAQVNAERDRLIAEAQASGRKEKENLLAQALQEIAKLRSEAETAIARDQSQPNRRSSLVRANSPWKLRSACWSACRRRSC